MPEPSKKELKQIYSKSYLKGLNRDKLILRLRKLSQALAKHQQEDTDTVKNVPEAIIQPNLLKHKNAEIQILVALCHAEILRIYAPNPPYRDDELDKIFKLFLSQFPGVGKKSNQHYMKYFHLLENLCLTQAYLILNDIDDEESLRIRMFEMFFQLKAQNLGTRIEYFMLEMMKGLVDESEGITQALLDTILEQLRGIDQDEEEKSGPRSLALNLVSKTENVLEGPITHFLTETVLQAGETSSSVTEREEQLEILHNLAINSPDLVLRVLTEFVGNLKNEDVDRRKEATYFFGRLLSHPRCVLTKQYQILVEEFVGRMQDLVAEIRSLTISYVRDIIPRIDRSLSIKVQEALKSRCVDMDEDVRKNSVAAIVHICMKHPATVSHKLLFAVGARALDKKISVRREALVGLATLFKEHIAERWKNGRAVDAAVKSFTWIPTRLMNVAAQGDRMSYFVEGLLENAILPDTCTPAERMRCLMGVYANFSPESSKAFHHLMKAKRTVRETVSTLLETLEEDDDAENQINVKYARIAKYVPDPGHSYSAAKILKDLFTHRNPNVINLLKKMVDCNTEYRVLRGSQAELLKILGLKGPSNLFVKRLIQRMCKSLIPIDGLQTLHEETFAHMEAGRRALANSGLALMQFAATNSPSITTVILADLVSGVSSCQAAYIAPVMKIMSYCALESQDDNMAKKTLEKLSPFIENKSPTVAKLAARCLCKTPNSASHLTKILKKTTNGLKLSKELPVQLRVMGEIALSDPSLFASFEQTVVDFVINDILPLAIKGKMKAHIEASKVAGVKFLQKYSLGLPNLAEELENKVEPVMKALVQALEDEKQEVIELDVAKALVKLCSLPSYYKILQTNPSAFCRLALVMDSDKETTEAFGRYLVKRLGTHPKVPFEFFSFFALCIHSKDMNGIFSKPLRKLIQVQRELVAMSQKVSPDSSDKAVYHFPETSSAHLIYILSKHPLVDEDAPKYKYFLKVINSFFDFFCHGNQENNFSLIVNILATVKLHIDREDESNENVYRMAELAHHALKAKFEGKHYKESSHPLSLPLPRWLYKLKRDRKLQSADQYLPDNFKVTPNRPSPARRQRKKKRVNGNTEEDEDEKYVPRSTRSRRIAVEDDEEEGVDDENVPKDNNRKSDQNKISRDKQHSKKGNAMEEENEVVEEGEGTEEEEEEKQKEPVRRTRGRNKAASKKSTPKRTSSRSKAKNSATKRSALKSPRKSLAKKRSSPSSASTSSSKRSKKEKVEVQEDSASEVEYEERIPTRRGRRRK